MAGLVHISILFQWISLQNIGRLCANHHHGCFSFFREFLSISRPMCFHVGTKILQFSWITVGLQPDYQQIERAAHIISKWGTYNYNKVNIMSDYLYAYT